ncbi:hypothetical protein D5086_032764 [Populus alba]|uniref:Uncharacterized protein n=1 Tax=Populus alba TaxID=43335 RepID=A0ACC4AEY3_POPAL
MKKSIHPREREEKLTSVEMILQALEYEMEHGKVLDEFFLSTAGKFQTEIGKSWAAEIASRRKATLAKKQN